MIAYFAIMKNISTVSLLLLFVAVCIFYELSGRGFESRCCHLNFKYRACFEQAVP